LLPADATAGPAAMPRSFPGGSGESAAAHRNPVKRGLVLQPQQWPWSSYRHYADRERGAVLVNEERKAELKVCKVA